MDVAHRQTVRLRLRPERPWREHERLYVNLFTDPAVAATLWPGALGGPRTPAQAIEMLNEDIAHWRDRRFGPWVFFESSTGVFVGRGGLRATTLAEQECVEVLYAVREDAWGQGYATEIALTAIAHARRMGLREVVGLTATTNLASRRVLEKSGMRIDDYQFEHVGIHHWLGRLLPNI